MLISYRLREEKLKQTIATLQVEKGELAQDVRRAIQTLYSIRVSSEHYRSAGNKHRNLKSIRERSTRLLAAMCARHPEIARAALEAR